MTYYSEIIENFLASGEEYSQIEVPDYCTASEYRRQMYYTQSKHYKDQIKFIVRGDQLYIARTDAKVNIPKCKYKSKYNSVFDDFLKSGNRRIEVTNMFPESKNVYSTVRHIVYNHYKSKLILVKVRGVEKCFVERV